MVKSYVSLLVPLFTASCLAVPNGFVDEGVVDIIAIAGAFAPNPRKNGKPMLLLSAKEGLVNVLEDPDNSDNAIIVADLSSILCSNGERGLQSILPHPNFKSNGYIFMYYSRKVANCPEDAKTGPSNRLSRFTMSASTLKVDLSSEVVLLETPPSPKRVHNGGAMAIGNDGLLYMTTGDTGQREPAYSQDLQNLYGKVLRLDVNGNVPDGNPYTKASGKTGVSCRKSKGRPPSGSPSNAVCEEIFASGLRNPFRISMDVNTKNKVLFTIQDVGASLWEEISHGGSDFKGTNYNWPVYEGPCKGGSISECSVPGGGKTDPFYYYLHSAAVDGGAVTGAVFPPDGLWPAKYKYLFADFIFGGIYNLIDDKSKACRTCKPPIPSFRNETFHKHPDMVDMFFGPYKSTQALYIVSRSEGQNVRRIRYTASTNKAPVAVASASKMNVKLTEVIAYKGSDSSDADGDSLSFLWDFGNGQKSTDTNPRRSYTKLGQYTVTLTVTDSKGQASQTFLTIVVGTPPTASMQSPAAGSKFFVGQKLRLKGSATDSQGKSLSSDQIFWEVRQHHASHFHPFLDRISGNDFDLFPAPAPEDFTAATNSFLEVIMYAVDSNGLTTTISRNIEPKKVSIDIDSRPQNLKVLVDEFEVVTPSTITSWESHKLRLDAKDQGQSIFSWWSIGGSRKTTFKVPKLNSTNPKITANFISSRTVPRAPQSVSVPTPRVTPTSTLPALNTEIIDCSSTNLCNRCQGDCNTDDDCEGNLVCYQKGSGAPGKVPSCSGVDLSRTDWCVLP